MIATRPDLAALTADAQAACDAWQAELVRQFGRDACNARYDARGTSTPTLAALCQRKLATGDARHAAWQFS